jgi:transcription antitermination factor NusG
MDMITDTPILTTPIAPTSSTSLEWFAVYTNSCQEKRVAQHCDNREIEHFLPLRRSLRRWKNGCTVLSERPLFPGYLFVKVEKADRVRVLELPGVHSLIGRGREPVALPSADIEALRRGLDELNAEPAPFLQVGQKAKVTRGPLEGLIGFVIRKKGQLRLVLSVDLIMKSVSLEVDALDLEAVSASNGHSFLLQ